MNASGRRRPTRAVAVAGVLALVAVVAGVGIVAIHRSDSASACGDRLLPATSASSGFFTPAQLAARPDPRLDTLMRAVRRWPAPFGKILGGVAFDYGQYVSTAALGGAVGVSTKRDPDFDVLDAHSLRPRWGLAQAAVPHAYDVGRNRYLALSLPRHAPLQMAAYDVTAGRQLWCTTVGTAPSSLRGALATAVQQDGDVLVLHGGPALSRISGTSGRVEWSRRLPPVGAGTGLFQLGEDRVVLGGLPDDELPDPGQLLVAARATIRAVAAGTGRLVWDYRPPRHEAASIIAASPDRVVLAQYHYGRSAQGHLVVLDGSGHRVWARSPAHRYFFDATVRDDAVIVEGPHTLTSYALANGRLRWRIPLPTTRPFLPYGFTLSQLPQLSESTMLVPTPDSLIELSLTDGHESSVPLPVDGINTTYWPYQLTVAGPVLVLATNTGALAIGLKEGSLKEGSLNDG